MSLRTSIRFVVVYALFCSFETVSRAKDVPPRSKHDGKKEMKRLAKEKETGGSGRGNVASPVRNGSFWERSGLFEGDILLATPGRNGIVGEQYKWPGGVIPYAINDEVCHPVPECVAADSFLEDVKQAMQNIEKETCITFRPYKAGDKSWVYITYEDPGCWSLVGRQYGGQHVNLGLGCDGHVVANHELIHTIGFWHQQSAANRDDYIEIKMENIMPGTESNFAKYDESWSTDYGVEYDYGSIMHYEPYAFSINGQPTIVAKQHNIARIGPGDGMTSRDIQKIRLMYKCSKKGVITEELSTTDRVVVPTSGKTVEPGEKLTTCLDITTNDIECWEPPATQSYPGNKSAASGTTSLDWSFGGNLGLSAMVWTAFMIRWICEAK